MQPTVKLRIIPSPTAIDVIVTLIHRYLEDRCTSANVLAGLSLSLNRISPHLVEQEQAAGPIEFRMYLEPAKARLEIKNFGFPLFMDPEATTAKDRMVAEALQAAKRDTPEMEWENLGSGGQTLRFTLPLKPLPSKPSQPLAQEDDSDVEIRKLKAGEEAELSRLFHAVYGYNYINSDVYYPRRLRAMIADQDLISVVAIQSGSVVGHVGLLRHRKDSGIYEVALGAVDPSVKSSGLFSRLFQENMNLAAQLPMRFCVFDLVTNHDYSQRLVARHGSHELAIMIGSQTKKTQFSMAKLGGKDPVETDRYSILLAAKVQCERPFDDVRIPVNLGELADFILNPIGVQWAPTGRFDPLPREGIYICKTSLEQQAVHFDLVKSGVKAVDKILDEWRFLLRHGYQYAAIDVDLAQPGLGQIFDHLSNNGFFIAGFIPYQMGERLGFRFQSLGPTRVAFEEIKLQSQRSKDLLQIIQKNYESNRLL